MRTRTTLPLFLAALALAGCDESINGIDRPDRPTDLDARYEWALERWDVANGRPVGHPEVTVTWQAPDRWGGEPFRVYGRRAGQGRYSLIATVTSCDAGSCSYVDTNVLQGSRYDYYVSTADERLEDEAPSDYRVEVSVPAFTPPPAPRADSVHALDNALYLRWRDGGSGGAFWKYQVWLLAIDGAANAPYQTGETDAPGFLDGRARNGFQYSYRIAAVDTLGQVSNWSAPLAGAPRPDFSGELLYAYGDSTGAAGFRFVQADSLNPVLSGDSPQAQWRLEVNGGAWQIRPLGETEVADAGRTTALVCGPSRDPGCRAVFQAPTTGYTRGPVSVNPEFSYVFRVRGSDGRIHHGVVRAEILGNSGTKRLMIFDWAYQLRADDPRLVQTR